MVGGEASDEFELAKMVFLRRSIALSFSLNADFLVWSAKCQSFMWGVLMLRIA